MAARGNTLMQHPRRPLLIALLVGWLWASFLTWLGWSTQIEGKAFRCNDDMFPFVSFRTDIGEHFRAGDTLGAGWTWDKIRSVQHLYEQGFYCSWFLGGLVTYLFLKSRTSKSGTEQNAAPNAGSAHAPPASVR
jgi:hypothetical protein